jgi:hypothetical protein
MPRAALVLCLLASSPFAMADSELFPEPMLRLEGARYEPTSKDLYWDTWIGAGAGLLRLDHTNFVFRADVETTAGDTRRAFDATQANYHLEPSIRQDFGGDRAVSLFFHHVSRHEIDTQKTAAVDWNVLGVRASAPLPGIPARLTVSLGHTTQESLIGYEWEMSGRLEGDLLRRPWGGLYSIVYARGVTTQPSTTFPRSGFLDFRLEGGARIGRDERTLQFFVAYEHRNDVLILEPGFKDRTLFGLRIALRSATPAP